MYSSTFHVSDMAVGSVYPIKANHFIIHYSELGRKEVRKKAKYTSSVAASDADVTRHDIIMPITRHNPNMSQFHTV